MVGEGIAVNEAVRAAGVWHEIHSFGRLIDYPHSAMTCLRCQGGSDTLCGDLRHDVLTRMLAFLPHPHRSYDAPAPPPFGESEE